MAEVLQGTKRKDGAADSINLVVTESERGLRLKAQLHPRTHTTRLNIQVLHAPQNSCSNCNIKAKDMTEVQQTKRPRVKSGRLIRLYVSDIHAENIMRFYAESDISMKGMMDAYADKFSLDLDKTRFLYCGMRIHHGQTPHEYDMEDGDEIEVFQEMCG